MDSSIVCAVYILPIHKNVSSPPSMSDYHDFMHFAFYAWLSTFDTVLFIIKTSYRVQIYTDVSKSPFFTWIECAISVECIHQHDNPK